MVPSCIAPRVAVAGLRGGSGKTLVALGLSRAFRERGWVVRPFKKGPDYIDAAWHTVAAGFPCRNLDTFLMGPDQVRRSFLRNLQPETISLLEGNRGVFDGMDVHGTHSTAELAKLLNCPVILVADCTKATRTMASVILGCKAFDANLRLGGVVLNRVAGSRHETMARQAIEEYTGVPVLGAIPRLRDTYLGERYLGLLPPSEHGHAERAINLARRVVEESVDVDKVFAIADTAEPLKGLEEPALTVPARGDGQPRIGIVRDSAFNFYYSENIEELRAQGAELVEVDALRNSELPALDGLYIGGGFPETHAVRLAANEGFRRSLRLGIEQGLPVYAECGGLTYLCEAIRVDGNEYPMTGVFPVTFEIAPTPQGHGYAVMEVDEPNPFFIPGTVIHGHEFRYSRVLAGPSQKLRTAYQVKRGQGFDGVRDGLCYKNVLASFCHIHAGGMKQWAPSLVNRALDFRRSEFQKTTAFEGVT